MTDKEIMQQVVNINKAGLLAQGKKSQKNIALKGLTCAYRGEDNTKCAIGFLIPDTKYKPNFEVGIEDLMEDYSWAAVFDLPIPEKIDEMLDFLGDLQKIHDQFDPARWQEKFIELAQNYNLES